MDVYVSTNKSHLWCVCVLDSISCTKSICLYLIMRLCGYIGFNSGVKWIKIVHSYEQKTGVYLPFYQKNIILGHLVQFVRATFDYDLMFHTLNTAISSPFSVNYYMRPQYRWVFAVGSHTICKKWLHPWRSVTVCSINHETYLRTVTLNAT